MGSRKKRRLYLVLACGLGLCSATGLMLAAFSSSLTYFLAPKEIAAKAPPPGESFRLGGIVQVGTVHTAVIDGTPLTTFRVTDGSASVAVSYSGLLPDLFREGQGVVAIGSMADNRKTFIASEVLAKHGSSYMPRDVEQALKNSGKWDPRFGPPPNPATWDAMSVTPTANTSTAVISNTSRASGS
jgi:cytochrome c-type biogenesis protein CcmE